MTRRVTRRQAHALIAPMRTAMQRILDTGESHAIDGYAVAKCHDGEYVRLEWLCAGFRGLIQRSIPGVNIFPLLRVERRLKHEIPLLTDEITEVQKMLREFETKLIKCSVGDFQSAILTEEIQIELDAIAEDRKAA